MKILIVEDHPSVAHIVDMMIKEISAEIEVEHHTEWQKGLESIQSNTPDFVITDIQIGEHKQLYMMVECHEKKIPCMVFSSYINPTILGYCEDYRARVVVAKSAPIEEVKQGLKCLINNHRYRCSICRELMHTQNQQTEDMPKVIFSPAEEFVILAQIEGKTTVQLSHETKKSKYTIRNQRMSLMEKNGCTMEEIVRRYLFWHTKG
jgi:DNA-binding NarL/FixJ family response regulator